MGSHAFLRDPTRSYAFLRVFARLYAFLRVGVLFWRVILRRRAGVLFGRVILRGPALRASEGFCWTSRLSARSYAILFVFAPFCAVLRVGIFVWKVIFLRRQVGVLFGKVILRGSALRVPQGFCGTPHLFARSCATLWVSARFRAFLLVPTRGDSSLEGYFEDSGGPF